MIMKELTAVSPDADFDIQSLSGTCFDPVADSRGCLTRVLRLQAALFLSHLLRSPSSNRFSPFSLRSPDMGSPRTSTIRCNGGLPWIAGSTTPTPVSVIPYGNQSLNLAPSGVLNMAQLSFNTQNVPQHLYRHTCTKYPSKWHLHLKEHLRCRSRPALLHIE
jgi:hypothetical protein